jgi:hypothetical protein
MGNLVNGGTSRTDIWQLQYDKLTQESIKYEREFIKLAVNQAQPQSISASANNNNNIGNNNSHISTAAEHKVDAFNPSDVSDYVDKSMKQYSSSKTAINISNKLFKQYHQNKPGSSSMSMPRSKVPLHQSSRNNYMVPSASANTSPNPSYSSTNSPNPNYITKFELELLLLDSIKASIKYAAQAVDRLMNDIAAQTKQIAINNVNFHNYQTSSDKSKACVIKQLSSEENELISTRFELEKKAVLTTVLKQYEIFQFYCSEVAELIYIRLDSERDGKITRKKFELNFQKIVNDITAQGIQQIHEKAQQRKAKSNNLNVAGNIEGNFHSFQQQNMIKAERKIKENAIEMGMFNGLND